MRFLPKRLYKNVVSSLSFSSELRKMRRELNAKIDMPDTIAPPPPSHARGVNRWFKRRRVSIAESYLMVVRDLDSRHSRSRLDALRVLIDVSFHSKSLDLPLNTARVQMALIKEVVKNRHNKRRQLELLQDFSISTNGQHQVIRKLCDELNIIELPEGVTRLEDAEFGWDDHVHDTATSGRKNATQLIIDAFIKGISELTVAYGSRADLEMMEEALEAGRIVGIKVNIGFEFSMAARGLRFHFMALLPPVDTPESLREFFDRSDTPLKEFLEGLEKNQANRIEAVKRLLGDFNATSLVEINRGFGGEALYTVPELTLEELNAFIPTASINRMHLAEFLGNLYKPILLNRILLLKVRRGKAKQDAKRKRIPDSEYRAIDEEYSRLRRIFKDLTPDQLLKQYFSGPGLIEYQSVFEDIDKVVAQLRSAGCRLKLLQPLEYGAEHARRLLEEYRRDIDVVELYNMQDCAAREPEEVVGFARFVNELNRKCRAEGASPLIPACGSDSTGRNPKIPGMGFVYEDKIVGKKKSEFLSRHKILPPLIAAMTLAKGQPVEESRTAEAPEIVSLGKISGGSVNVVGDESGEGNVAIPLVKAFRYLNPTVKNYLYTFIGFIVANYFIGTGYALLWLGITGFRNSIADLISNRGARLSEWKLKSINFDNVAQSLFWTGFSVPILGFIKANFDAVWPWGTEGVLFNMAKFFFISFANGLYLAAHNTLRGFDKKVVRANIFRSVIAWPFATAFAPLGNLLNIPSIVQAKIWSDVVAGFIEGGSKYLKVVRLRRQNLEEIVPHILEPDGEEKYIAILDLLYLFKEEPRTESSMKAVFGLARGPVVFSPRAAKTDMKSFEELRRALGGERLDDELADFILSRYEQEMAADLVSLVADTLPAVREWMETRSVKNRNIPAKEVKR
jgi:hypothetical protein